ncbi:MAG: hypothetical protein J6B59_01220 [Alistipes sp.]|nr:hypothetical protein [Alistipes sp.]
MNRTYFRNIAIVVFTSFVLLAFVQAIWVERIYHDQVADFTRRVEAAAYKSIYKAFRMNALPGLSVATQVRIDLDEFALEFEPALLEQGTLQPYAVEIIDRTADSRVIMRRNEWAQIESAHYSEIEIDDAGQFALRLAVEVPYGRFWGQMRGLIFSSVAIVLLLGGVLIYLVRTMFRQRTLEAMRRDFTHNITHELKTPLSVAVAATDALRNFDADVDPTRRKAYLEMIDVQLRQLTAMVERILSVSVEGRKERFSPEQVLLKPLFAELVQGVEFGGGEQRRIEVCCPDTLQLTADRFHLYNLLSTLLDNALKYAGEEAEVTLSATAIDNGVELRVSDTGCGIAREHLPHLFDKFYRVPTGDLQPTRGYGLGLYYARRVAEMHGGTIVAQSRVGKGTTIIVTIPNHE